MAAITIVFLFTHLLIKCVPRSQRMWGLVQPWGLAVCPSAPLNLFWPRCFYLQNFLYPLFLFFSLDAMSQKECILLNESKSCTVFTSLRVIYAFDKTDSNPELELKAGTSTSNREEHLSYDSQSWLFLKNKFKKMQQCKIGYTVHYSGKHSENFLY